MKYKRMKLVRANYSYHPDFIEDKAEPNGYRVLDTGRYVVDWTIRDFYVFGSILKAEQHYSCSFLTADEAERFVQKLYNGVEPDGSFLTTQDNDFFFGK